MTETKQIEPLRLSDEGYLQIVDTLILAGANPDAIHALRQDRAALEVENATKSALVSDAMEMVGRQRQIEDALLADNAALKQAPTPAPKPSRVFDLGNGCSIDLAAVTKITMCDAPCQTYFWAGPREEDIFAVAKPGIAAECVAAWIAYKEAQR